MARLSTQDHDLKQSHPSHIRLKHLTEYTKRILHDFPNVIARDCKSSNYTRVKHSYKTWKFLQRIYRVEAHRLGRRNFGVRWTVRHTGMQIPFHVRDDGPRGRSVYAAIDVPKGSKVWNPSKLATFEHPRELVHFLLRLPHDLQCDVLLWAYPDAENEYVGLALDEGTFINHADSDDLKNLDSSGYALRDIQAGEEILEDYTEFIGVDTLEWFNIIRSIAWEEDIDVKHDSSSSAGAVIHDIHNGYVHAGAPEAQKALPEHNHRLAPSFDFREFYPIIEERLEIAETTSTTWLLLIFGCFMAALLMWRRVSVCFSKVKDAKACQ